MMGYEGSLITNWLKCLSQLIIYTDFKYLIQFSINLGWYPWQIFCQKIWIYEYSSFEWNIDFPKSIIIKFSQDIRNTIT